MLAALPLVPTSISVASLCSVSHFFVQALGVFILLGFSVDITDAVET